MGFLLAILAFFCGLALALHFSTGDLKPEQVAGVGLMCISAAVMIGAAIPSGGWPWNRP